MNKIVSVLKKYMYVISVFIGVSIILKVSYSNFLVSSNNHKAAEMYIGSLKYSISIDSNETNTLTVEPGITILDVKVNNLNPVDTYYKLLYLNNSNLEIKYFSETKDTDEVKTSYKSPNDSVTSSNTNNLKLFIRNNSDANQDVSFSLKGGYINNTLNDISVPNGYSEITIDNSSDNTYFCKTNDTLTQGLKYVNGQYTYGYKMQGYYSSSSLSWQSISNNGWGVQLTDKTSTSHVTSKLCTYINNKPVISVHSMFSNSQATILDLSSFNTSNVTNMEGMFSGSQATILDLSSFNTSNVTNMEGMFSGSQVTIIDASNFNTSNVINMKRMFNESQATTLNLSSFDTSKVTDMSWMFNSSQVTTLDLSSFDTSNVINMSVMFQESKATTLDLSNFDTSNVTNMTYMFSNNKATTLDLSSFEVSNVESMNYMFNGAEATIGYAKDEESASKFNASSNKPDSLVFVVKTIGNVIKAEKPSGFENTVRGGLYRFVGSSNNYICLGTCSDSTRYRVIGITDNSSLNTDLGLKENQVKIIRDKYYSSNSASGTGDWEKYEINTYLNQTEINNIIPSGWDSKITSQKWYKYYVSNSNASTADDIITTESKSMTSTNTKLGLMSLSDYYYSETSGGTKSCYSFACTNTWLYDSSIEQKTMSYYGAIDTGSETKYFWYIPYNGKALYSSIFATRPPDGTIYNTIKPVMYLDANVLVKGSGSGTLDDPFILKAN